MPLQVRRLKLVGRSPARNRTLSSWLGGWPSGFWLATFCLIGTLVFTGRESWLIAFCTAFVLGWLTINLPRSSNGRNALRLPTFDGLALIFCLWLAASCLWSRAPGESMFQLWPTILFITASWTYALERDSERLWLYLRGVVVVVAAILTMISVEQHFLANAEVRSVFWTRNTHAAFMNLSVLGTITYAIGANSSRGASASWRERGVTVLVFLFAFSIGLTASRGASLALAAALALSAAVLIRHLPRRLLFTYGGAVLAGFLCAEISLRASAVSLGSRMSTFATSDRIIIWKSAWKMMHDAPWLGTGVATFPYAWPSYKDPADGATGFFVHNDYLQLWIETGAIGLAVFLAFALFVLARYVRAMRSPRCDSPTRVEMTGLFAALLATALHSFVDFNFHIPAVMLICGLMLGRLRELSLRVAPASVLSTPHPAARTIGASVARTVLVVAVLYLVAYGASDVLAAVGERRAREGDVVGAQTAFHAAAVLGPMHDRVLMGYADLIRQLLPQIPATDNEARRRLFETSARLLARVDRLNPLRWDSAWIQGKLYRDTPEIAGPRAHAVSENAFHRSITLNPWFYYARMDLAALLIDAREYREAKKVLWDGLRFTQPPSPGLLRYYAFALIVHQEWGTAEETARIRKLIVDADRALKDQGDVDYCSLAARLWRTC